MKNLLMIGAVLLSCAASALEMQNIAHRGMWDKQVPQNTVEAIRRAYDAGATWVETDFWHLKNGLKIVMHAQKELEKQTLTTKKVQNLTAEDLATLNLGAGEKLEKVYRIPTWEQVLSVVPKKGGVLQAEIKGYSPQYADLFDQAVKAAGLTEENIVVSSFQYAALKDFKARYPKYRTVWLVALNKKKAFDVKQAIADCQAAHFEVYCPGASTTVVMTPADADAIRAAGIEFRCYGVNSVQDLVQAKKMGAVGFTCNYWHKAFEWAQEVGGVTLKK